MRPALIRSLIAVAAVIGLAAPASAAVDLAIKRAIVEVVLENLGVSASEEFIDGIASELDGSELNDSLVEAVGNVLDSNADARDVIEDYTDADGDGVPDEGAAGDTARENHSPNPNSTEKSENSDDKSENSSNRNPNGTSNSSGSNAGNADDEDDDSDDDEESEDEDEPEDDD